MTDTTEESEGWSSDNDDFSYDVEINGNQLSSTIHACIAASITIMYILLDTLRRDHQRINPERNIQRETYLSRLYLGSDSDCVKTKRSIPSSSKGFTKRKKSKKNESDQSLHNYIVMMADSVTQVANAIQSSTRDFKERQIFNELMTELSSIPGFSAEEIDTIYENLSNNPTMIRSFLARPKESKARWMQKELGR